MAFCKYCGKEFKNEEAKFCVGCGKPRQQPPQPQTPDPQQYVRANELISNEINAADPPKKKSFIPVVIISLLLAVGLGAGYGYYSWKSNSSKAAPDKDDISIADTVPESIEPEPQSEPSQLEELQEDLQDEISAASEPLEEDIKPQADVQEETRAEPESALRDDSRMVMDTLYLYYTTYLDCLNQQTIVLLRGVTSSYDITAWITANLAYEFDFSAVVVDLDSLQFTSGTNAQVHTQFQYKYRKRGSNTWTNTKSTQIVYLVYDDLKEVWLIRDITINDNMALGNNQTVLN